MDSVGVLFVDGWMMNFGCVECERLELNALVWLHYFDSLELAVTSAAIQFCKHSVSPMTMFLQRFQ